MVESKESVFNVHGTCPKCGDLIGVKVVVSTELQETPVAKPAEEKPEQEAEKDAGTSDNPDESKSVRSDTGEGKPAGASGSDKPKNKRKAKGTKGTSSEE